MSYSIKQAPIGSRLGTGIGQGLSESIPKEIDRGRLASGLKQLSEKKGLSPFEQFAGLASIPGTTPQIIQSGSELLRQQAYLNSLKNQFQGKNGTESGAYKPTAQEFMQPVKGEVPTLATAEDTAQSYKSYIPPTEQQERQDAFDNFNANPARYNYDFENALAERKSITGRNQEIQKSHQAQEEKAVAKETKLKDAFDKESQRLGIIPMGENANFDPKLYQLFEQKLLNSILSKKEGGEGLTQEQATKKYSDELLKAYENYRDLSTLSSWSPKEFNRRVGVIQKNMDSLGQEAKKVIMDKLIADYQLSPLFAAHKAYPLKKGQIPEIEKFEGGALIPSRKGSYAQLKKQMGKTHSPLSIAYELQNNGADPRTWLNYLDQNRDDLEVWQANQLDKNINMFDLKDMWLRAWE